jgi:serine O-acetyltransferase
MDFRSTILDRSHATRSGSHRLGRQVGGMLWRVLWGRGLDRARGSWLKYDRDAVKEWAGNSQWRALRADYQRFREHGYSGWGSEGFWALAIYRAQRALRKSQRRRLLTPAAIVLAVLRKFLVIVTGTDLHPGADLGAGMLIQHGSQIRVIENTRIGVDCALSHVCSIGAGVAPGAPKIGDHVYIAPHTCILGPVTIGDGSTIAPCSLVLSDVPAGHTAIGVPARIVPRFNVQGFRKDNVSSSSSGEGKAGAGGDAPSRREDA